MEKISTHQKFLNKVIIKMVDSSLKERDFFGKWLFLVFRKDTSLK